jgi:hypothetical protein
MVLLVRPSIDNPRGFEHTVLSLHEGHNYFISRALSTRRHDDPTRPLSTTLCLPIPQKSHKLLTGSLHLTSSDLEFGNCEGYNYFIGWEAKGHNYFIDSKVEGHNHPPRQREQQQRLEPRAHTSILSRMLLLSYLFIISPVSRSLLLPNTSTSSGR